MSLLEQSQHLSALAAARRSADDAIERAINNLREAHKNVVDSVPHLEALDSAKARRGEALSELADYLATAREMLAETALALIDLHPNKETLRTAGGNMVTTPIMHADGRKGMEAKRLAKWEAAALREEIVAVLAGDENVTDGAQ